MDELSKRLLMLATDPNASMEELIDGMNRLSAAIDQDNRRRRKVQAEQHRQRVRSASGDELRRLANENLSRRYR